MPARYNNQLDLFALPITDFDIRDLRESMERPFFALSKKRFEPINYQDESGQVMVEVTANQDYGMATIWDADILIWAASVITKMKDEGKNDIPAMLKFQPYDLLEQTGRGHGGKEYRRLRAALDRLSNTTVRTTIRAPRDKSRATFHWISGWKEITDPETGRVKGMSIALDPWFLESILQKGGVLALDPAYFKITGGIDRWLYRVARKHAGGAGSKGFTIHQRTLFEKSGSKTRYAQFRSCLRKIVSRNALPGIDLAWEPSGRSPKEPKLRMTMIRDRKSGAAPQEQKEDTYQPKVKAQEAGAGRARATLKKSTHLTDATMRSIRKNFGQQDVYALQADFDAWLASNPSKVPANYQAAFYGFVKRKYEREEL